jgi:hypothetical protein
MRLTFNDRTDFEVDVLHVVINAAIDREGLGCCHARLLLRQSVKPQKRLLDFIPPDQPLKILLYTKVKFQK